MIISLLIMIVSNMILLLVKGTLPIFSENPSEAKVLLYTGGWGIVRRIDFALVNFVLAVPLIKLFHPKIALTFNRKVFYITCILICALILVTMGSKSSLLSMLNILFGVILINRTFGISVIERTRSYFNALKITKFAKYAFVAAVISMFVVIALSGIETTVGDALITRLIASGDVFYFFYVYDIESSFNKLAYEYVPHILNPLLGMFRFAEYEYPLGVYTLYYSINLPMDAQATFGPNSQHPIEGLVYFGIFGAPLYSFIIGYLISYIRLGLLRKFGPYPDCMKMLVYVILSSLIIICGTDVPFFMQVLYDTIIFGLLVLVTAFVITEGLKNTLIVHNGN